MPSRGKANTATPTAGATLAASSCKALLTVTRMAGETAGAVVDPPLPPLNDLPPLPDGFEQRLPAQKAAIRRVAEDRVAFQLGDDERRLNIIQQGMKKIFENVLCVFQFRLC